MFRPISLVVTMFLLAPPVTLGQANDYHFDELHINPIVGGGNVRELEGKIEVLIPENVYPVTDHVPDDDIQRSVVDSHPLGLSHGEAKLRLNHSISAPLNSITTNQWYDTHVCKGILFGFFDHPATATSSSSRLKVYEIKGPDPAQPLVLNLSYNAIGIAKQTWTTSYVVEKVRLGAGAPAVTELLKVVYAADQDKYLVSKNGGPLIADTALAPNIALTHPINNDLRVGDIIRVTSSHKLSDTVGPAAIDDEGNLADIDESTSHIHVQTNLTLLPPAT